MREANRFCDVTIELCNEGSAPATNVDLEVSFPADSFVVAHDDLDSDSWSEVLIPGEPKPEWLLGPGRYYMPFLAEHLQPHPTQVHGPRGPLYDTLDRHIVWYKHPNFKHQDQWYLGSLRVFLPPTVSRGFNVAYRAHADTLMQPAEGELSVKLQEARPDSAEAGEGAEPGRSGGG